MSRRISWFYFYSTPAVKTKQNDDSFLSCVAEGRNYDKRQTDGLRGAAADLDSEHSAECRDHCAGGAGDEAGESNRD